MVESKPVYFTVEGEDVFGLFQAAVGQPGTAVLVCPPWGWDEVASYRSRRRWAELLAAAGHPVLRFDLPASGDSGGGPATPALLDRWLEAIAVAAAWLRAEGGSERLALLGLGLGGLLAEEALARGVSAEDLVVWGAPASGRHFARETRAFAQMQDGRPIERGPDTSPLPEGWFEAGGFVLSAETLDALKGLKSEPEPARALLLGRDGVLDEARSGRLKAAGAEVATGPGEGWGRLVGHPETSVLPDAVEREVREWLAAAKAEPPAGAPSAPPTRAEARFEGFVESPLRIADGYGNAFGVLARPQRQAAPLCAVFLNAGAIRHIGPNRLWTETARRFAARGVPSLRVDLEAIGEADGDVGKRLQVSDFYDTVYEGQVKVALDALVAGGSAERFLLVGLCAGGFWSFRTALDDPRIEAAVLVNAGALSWHPGILDEREARRFDRVFQLRWWKRLLRGEIRLSKLLGFGKLILVKAGLLGRRLLGRAPAAAGAGTAIGADLDRLPNGRRVLLAFSGEEPLYVELERLGILGQLANWPGVELAELPGSDHTLRSIAAQRAVSKLLDEELGQALAGSDSPSGRQR